MRVATLLFVGRLAEARPVSDRWFTFVSPASAARLRRGDIVRFGPNVDIATRVGSLTVRDINEATGCFQSNESEHSISALCANDAVFVEYEREISFAEVQGALREALDFADDWVPVADSDPVAKRIRDRLVELRRLVLP